MSDPSVDSAFLRELTAIVEKNISNEQFGVSELADAMNMSRSNLLRKVKKETKLSVSQLINQVRLKRAMELLRTTSANISEVSHQTGFNSPSYFIKCFREYYGYPPGEVGKRRTAEKTGMPDAVGDPSKIPARKPKWLAAVLTLAAVLLILMIGYVARPSSDEEPVEKSIAVLPFKNESNDSTNIYLINGLMEATLTNLQQIKDLRVISRTSAEKYRNTPKTVPEIARELNVQYFVEGSGQKIGDHILLNIQLIDATTDRHLWAKQYRKEANDIFELQQEIAKNIADEIEVIVTPEAKERIEKKPTDDLVAYDYYLKGRDLFYKSGADDLKASIPWFKRAIERDPKFALAYANAAMVFYYLDIFQTEKKYTTDIVTYADKALSLDLSLPESQIAKGLAFAHQRDFESAIPYLEKAWELNPNTALSLHFLTEFYSIHVPDPSKYLEYALLKVRVDKELLDSNTTAFNYFHLANAYLQCGFLNEAQQYMDKSLAFNPNGFFSGYVKILVQFAKTRDIPRTRQRLLEKLRKDTTRFDIMQEIGRMYFLERDYERAYPYYKKLNETREFLHLDLYKEENLRIARVFAKKGLTQEADALMKSFKQCADNNRSVYKDALLSMYYANTGDNTKALDYLKRFAQKDNYMYWILLMEIDPEADSIMNHPDFKKAMRDIEKTFWEDHKKIQERLKRKGLI